MESRRLFVYGGLGRLGSEVCEQALARGDVTVVCYDDCECARLGSDVVNGWTVEEKRRALDRLSSHARFVRASGSVRRAVEGATEAALIGLCRDGGGATAHEALASSGVECAVVASSAAAYDASTGGARRGGRSERTHRRPALAESDASLSSEEEDDEGGDEATRQTRRLERAVKEACRERRVSVAVLRYFGVFGGSSRWAASVARSGDLGVPSVGAYGSSDFCGLSDAADACLRALDVFRSRRPPREPVVINVGTGKAHRAESVSRAVSRTRAAPARAAPTFGAADVSKLKALLAWSPSPSLEPALSRELARAVAKESRLEDARPPAVDNRSQPPAVDHDDGLGSPSRSLAALDLSSCTNTTLLQVRTNNSPASRKHLRFFILNQRTVQTHTRTSNSNRTLATVFAAA